MCWRKKTISVVSKGMKPEQKNIYLSVLPGQHAEQNQS